MAKRNYPPLVITTAVSPRNVPYLSMTNSNERILKYQDGIDIWLKKIPDLRIVLCDGTGFDWSPIVQHKYKLAHIECLSHFNDIDGVQQYGKGFGEVQSLNYAVDNSRLISESKQFMKITGKYWINNIDKFAKNDLFSEFKCKSIFKISRWSVLYVNSAFFSCSVHAYKKYFYESYKLINDHTGKDLEHVLGDVIVNNDIKNYQFRTSPAICGWTGTGNHAIDLSSKSIKDKLREVKYWCLSWIL
jgi:hypothetical protein